MKRKARGGAGVRSMLLRVFFAAGVNEARAARRQSMIPKSGYRFSEKIMLHEKVRAG